MNTLRIASISALALTLSVSSLVAHADTGLTRAQVLAELAEAQRTGDIPEVLTGKKLNEIFPSAYPKSAAKVEVKALPARVNQAATARPAPTGNIEYDAVAQRGAEAMARGAASHDNNQFAGR